MINDIGKLKAFILEQIDNAIASTDQALDTRVPGSIYLKLENAMNALAESKYDIINAHPDDYNLMLLDFNEEDQTDESE